MHSGAILFVLLLSACGFSKPQAVECAGADLALKLPAMINDVAALMRFDAELDRVQGQLFCLLQNSVSSDSYQSYLSRLFYLAKEGVTTFNSQRCKAC